MYTIEVIPVAIGRITMALFIFVMSAVVTAYAAGPNETEAKTGSINGLVRLEGVPPQLPPLNINKDKDFCKGVTNESLIVGPDKGLENVVAVLVGVPKAAAGALAPTPVYRLINANCRFVPHVIVMQFNGDLEISNTDPIIHTARTLRSLFDVGLFPGRIMRKPIGAPVLGPIKVICEIHPWMLAWLFLTDSPYYSVTDAYGRYEIENVPPGKYKLEFWHELFGIHEKNIEVRAGKATEVNFGFRAEQAQIK